MSSLKPQTKDSFSGITGLFKTVTKYLSDVTEWAEKVAAVSDKKVSVSLLDAVTSAAPWAGKAFEFVEPAVSISGELLPPAKFLVKLLEKATEINDSVELAEIACNLSFIRAVEKAIKESPSPTLSKQAIINAKAQLRTLKEVEIDYSTFSLDNSFSHIFFKNALKSFEASLFGIIYSETQRNEIIRIVKFNFRQILIKLLADKNTQQKFAPFRNRIMLGGVEEAEARVAIAEHAEYLKWLYNDAPVLGREPFALKDVYIETECCLLRWREIHNGEVNPFDEESGTRVVLIDKIKEFIANGKEKEPIFIQGVAGSGKSSFTLRLCDQLIKEGLSPIRIRFKDLKLDKTIGIVENLTQAVYLSDEKRSPVSVSPTPANLFLDGKLFQETAEGAFQNISRIVLVLDGWDEISITNEGLREQVQEILSRLRNEFVDSSTIKCNVKCVITGRPSSAVTESGMLRQNTPIFTLRQFSSSQFRGFTQKLLAAVEKRPVQIPDEVEDYWRDVDLIAFTEKLKEISEAYDREFNDEEISKLEVLGFPLLTHLTCRLVASWKYEAAELLQNQAKLYRNLVNLTCLKAGKAESDETASAEEIEIQARIWGQELRILLWQTATAMTVLGEDVIAYDELNERLEEESRLMKDEGVAERLTVRVKRVTDRLSSLLISFYFQSGQEQTGCEFSHKSFREYLFAEAIVEEIKNYARAQNSTRVNLVCERTPFWRDFDKSNPHYDFSRRLGRATSPQWLSPEVKAYLKDIINWEIIRTFTNEYPDIFGFDASRDIGMQTHPLTLDEWIIARNSLADIWDWWIDEVHLRPQIRKTLGSLELDPLFVIDLARYAMPHINKFDAEPPSFVSIDAHLGEAILTLNVFIHHFLGLIITRVHKVSVLPSSISQCVDRKHQATSKDFWTRFLPFKQKELENGLFEQNAFSIVSSRINSTGGRPEGNFPRRAYLLGIKIEGELKPSPLEWDDAFLDCADLSDIDFGYTKLTGVSLNQTTIRRVDFNNAIGLTLEQLLSANIDEETRVPEDFKHVIRGSLVKPLSRRGILRLKYIRQNSGVTVSELAREAKISDKTIRKIEETDLGKMETKTRILKALNNLLGEKFKFDEVFSEVNLE